MKRRWGPISTFSGVWGAGLSPAQAISPIPSAASLITLKVVPGRVAADTARPASDTLWLTIPRTPAATQLRLRRLGLRTPGLQILGRLCGVRLEIEQDRRQIHPGDAIDQRMVGLGDQREAIALEALDQPVLPQRL